jgi:hypothetical protein
MLVVIHASLDAVFGSKNKRRRSYIVTRAEVGTYVIPRLSFSSIFIGRMGY